MSSRKINVISLFTGAGGLDLGLESTGRFKTVFALDSDAACIATLGLNAGKRLSGAARFLAGAEIMRGDAREWLKTARAPSTPWVLVGGPPCQPFSAMGTKRNLQDHRSDGVFLFVDALEKLRPDGFLLENVPRLAVNQEGKIFRRILTAIAELGYSCSAVVLNAADFGSFTKRKRLFIYGVWGKEATLKALRPTHSKTGTGNLAPWRGVREALQDLEETPSGALPDHSVPHHTPAVAKRFQDLAYGQYDHVRKRAKLDPEQPCPSMMAGASSGFVHHIHYISRELTSRECARLQGFPDSYRFFGKPLLVAKQIVNAVPVPLAAAVGRALADSVTSSLGPTKASVAAEGGSGIAVPPRSGRL